MLRFLLVGYRYVGVECEILRVAARLGPCCGRRSRGILLPPEDIVSMYFSRRMLLFDLSVLLTFHPRLSDEFN